MSDEVTLTTAQRQAMFAELKAAGLVVVSTESWEQTQATAEQLRHDIAETQWKESERIVDAAIQARKLPRSKRNNWLKLMALDPQGTEQELAKLPSGGPGTPPGPPIGTDEDLSELESGSNYRRTAAQGTGLFPALEQRR